MALLRHYYYQYLLVYLCTQNKTSYECITNSRPEHHAHLQTFCLQKERDTSVASVM